ncbi:MAG TPA: hypothetical protein VMZ91_07615 [Candidatus Paceibacterota bacterium]|nr:hypothetical protein [Candidatus Paceibacterota bacterium]
MENFKEYITENEEQKYEELNEDIISGAINLLAVGTIVGLTAWGGTLLFVKAGNLVDKIINNFKKAVGIFKRIGRKEIKNAISDIKSDPSVKRQKDGTERAARKYEDELMHVLVAIEKKSWFEAKNEFMNLPKNLRNNPDIKKVIITDITREMKEPPLYVRSPGNDTYQAIKKVLDISTARAAATATRMALDKHLEQMEESTQVKKKDISLNEGITFFKNSIRLEKLADKITKNIREEEDAKKRVELKNFRKTILDVAEEFKSFEIKYKIKKMTGEKIQGEKIKHDYKKLEIKYFDLIEQINKESVLNALKNSGAAFFAVKVLIFGAMFFGTLGEAAYVMNMENSQFGGLTGHFNNFVGKTSIFDFMDATKQTIFGLGALGLGASALIRIVGGVLTKLREKKIVKKTIDAAKRIMGKIK